MTEHTQPPPRMAGLRARLSNALQMAGQHRGRARVWIAAAVSLLIGGVVWTGAVATAVASLHLSVAVANQGGSAAAATGGGGSSAAPPAPPCSTSPRCCSPTGCSRP